VSLAIVRSRAQVGVEAPPVDVEVHLAGGLPGTAVVGLPEAAVREARDRVKAALQNGAFEYPQRRVTISLAPADLPKDGSRFDLAMALGVLAASGQLPPPALAAHEFLGELALSGELRAITGVLPAVLMARRARRTLVVPEANGAEAALVADADVRTARSLLDVCAWLRGRGELPRAVAAPTVERASAGATDGPDLADVRGQPLARRALEVAAAGGHNLLLIGPPGSGKTLLASRLPALLPPLDEDSALEAAAIASVAGLPVTPADYGRPPFRHPHHSASAIALVGGGPRPRPGEISLAHAGVLFLDELPEFDRRVLEMLREPLESGRIHISRAACQAEFPARFQLVAAMNPCPCGYSGDASGRCRCNTEAIRRYTGRVSGPLIDRIDMHVEVPRLPHAALRGPPGESSAVVAARVHAARAVQMARSGILNARLAARDLERHCTLRPADQLLLERAIERLGLSARAWHRILRVARTLADIEGRDGIHTAHLTEAIGYRRLDRHRDEGYQGKD